VTCVRATAISCMTSATRQRPVNSTVIRERVFTDDCRPPQTQTPLGKKTETTLAERYGWSLQRRRLQQQPAETPVASAVCRPRRLRQQQLMRADSTDSMMTAQMVDHGRWLEGLGRPLDDTRSPSPQRPPPTDAAAAAAAAQRPTPVSSSSCSVDSGTIFSPGSRSVAAPGPARHAPVQTGSAAGWNASPARTPAVHTADRVLTLDRSQQWTDDVMRSLVYEIQETVKL